MFTHTQSHHSTDPMAPPPELRFHSRAKMESFVQEWAKRHGYAVTILNSSGYKNVFLQFDRSCAVTEGDRTSAQRASSSRGCGCPFKCGAYFPQRPKRPKAQAKYDLEEHYWTFKVHEGNHNHGPSPLPGAHPRHQRLSQNEKSAVRRMMAGNVHPQQIPTTLRETGGTLAVPRTIYNKRASICKEELDNKMPMEAFLHVLMTAKWHVATRVAPDTGKLVSMFFSHPEAVKMARRYHHVAIIDATYHTNKFHCPLLHCISPTACNKSFSCGFCLLPNETD